MKTSQDNTIKGLFSNYFFKLDNDVQRSYEWNDNNVTRFIKDIAEKDNHFIGILLTASDNDGYKTIFDGQQRFTTSVLCACAVKAILKKRNHDGSNYYKQTQNMLLYAVNENDEDSYKLTLRDDDNEVLVKLISGIQINKDEQKTIVYKNYVKIFNVLDKYSTENIESFYKHLLNAKFTELMCEDNEEGREQFYYLNSGQSITETRRLIALIVTHCEGKGELENFATTLSQKIMEDDANRLFSLFSWYQYKTPYIEKGLSSLENELKYNKNNICSQIYNFYKKWFKPLMIDHCFNDERRNYNFLFENTFTKASGSAVQIYTIKILESEQNELDKAKALKLMEWIVIVKRCVNNTATAKTISTFFNDWDNDNEKICDYIIKKAKELGFWLTPSDVVTYLKDNKTNEDILTTLLTRIESVSVKEPSISKNKVTLEHIYPQKPQNNVSYDEEIRPINRLGNLTLLGSSLNSSLQNKPFFDKKDSYQGSCFEITRRLANYSKWTINEVEKTETFYVEQLKKYYEL